MTDATTPAQPQTEDEQNIYVHDCLFIELTVADLQSLFEAMAKAGVSELDHIRISRHTDGLRIDSKPQAIEAQARPAVASEGLARALHTIRWWQYFGGYMKWKKRFPEAQHPFSEPYTDELAQDLAAALASDAGSVGAERQGEHEHTPDDEYDSPDERCSECGKVYIVRHVHDAACTGTDCAAGEGEQE